MKLVHEWLIVDDTIDDNTVFTNKVILLNKQRIEDQYENHLTKQTEKNITLLECFLIGVESKSKHYLEELDYMQLNQLYYLVIGDRN